MACAALFAMVSSHPKAAGPAAARMPHFEYDHTWPKLPIPNGWIFGSVFGLGVDSRDHVFVMHLASRIVDAEFGAAFAKVPGADCCFAAPPVVEFDARGGVVNAWGGRGEGYTWTEDLHGLFVDHQDNVWIGSVSESHLLKFTHDGRYLMTVGTPGVKGPSSNNPSAFGGPAPFVDASTNELFVADGYRSRRVAVLDATTGAFKRAWGAYGEKPDDSVPWKFNPDGADVTPSRQFQLASDLVVSADGFVYVADRSNNRIQVFKKDGTFVRERFILPKTPPTGTVSGLALSKDRQQEFLYNADPRDHRVWILRRSDLEILGSIGSPGHFAGAMNSPAYVTADSKGNLYVGEAQHGKRVQRFLYKGLRPAR